MIAQIILICVFLFVKKLVYSAPQGCTVDKWGFRVAKGLKVGYNGCRWGFMGNTTNFNTNLHQYMTEVDLIYKDECYELVGCAYAVYNSLKYGHYELFYQRAYADELIEKGFCFEREHRVRVIHKGKKIGSYSLDFLINNKIVVELKVAEDFYPMHVKQVLTYLKTTGKKLGIIILITPEGIRYKRLVN